MKINQQQTKEYWQIRETPQMLRAFDTLQDACSYGYTNVIIGETGSGKSFACDLFVKSKPNAFKIIIGSSDTIGDIIDKIIEALNIPTAKTKSKKIREIIKKLKGVEGNPMLILDEAEYMKQPALCAMKELYDSLNGICAIILVGTDQLIENIEKLRRRNKAGIPQLYRRIKFGIRYLEPIDRNYNEFLSEIQDKQVKRFLCENCENYGELHDVLVPALREADRLQQSLTVDLIRLITGIPEETNGKESINYKSSLKQKVRFI